MSDGWEGEKDDQRKEGLYNETREQEDILIPQRFILEIQGYQCL